MKRNYDECVTKYSDSFVRVVLDPDTFLESKTLLLNWLRLSPRKIITR